MFAHSYFGLASRIPGPDRLEEGVLCYPSNLPAAPFFDQEGSFLKHHFFVVRRNLIKARHCVADGTVARTVAPGIKLFSSRCSR